MIDLITHIINNTVFEYVWKTALILWVFWAFYVLVMGIYRAYLAKRLGIVNLILSTPFVLVGFFLDIFVNLCIAPIIFLDPPREWLVTTRLTKYRNCDSLWRRSIAAFICDHLLDIFDPTGNHC
ncbi:hypothetical protein UFOVP116_295 [uncultured Caudovirales phage]|uniref:Uncharacterized protein n=1 Tax=uncultured Caudovirales phage TaxID=2100421 RepID=A0A6J5L6X3_9CAUD|nr:hypothetical protein UFOVP116_295 [uncultured Caudovirales phage]